MVCRSWVCGTERLRGSVGRGIAKYVGRQRTPPELAVPRRSPRPPTYRLLRGNLTVQAVFTLPDLDGSTARGSPQRGVVRDRLRQQSLDHPAKKNENERGTSGAVIEVGVFRQDHLVRIRP